MNPLDTRSELDALVQVEELRSLCEEIVSEFHPGLAPVIRDFFIEDVLNTLEELEENERSEDYF